MRHSSRGGEQRSTASWRGLFNSCYHPGGKTSEEAVWTLTGKTSEEAVWTLTERGQAVRQAGSISSFLHQPRSLSPPCPWVHSQAHISPHPPPPPHRNLANPLRSQIMIETMLATHSCPTLCDPHGLQPTRLLHSWDSPGRNAGEGCHSLLQGIFLTQGLNPGLLHCRRDSLPSDPPGKPDSNTCIALFIQELIHSPFYPCLPTLMW